MRFLFFAELSYAYSILRPLQREIRRRGDEVAWLLLPTCPDRLEPDEKRVGSLREAIAYNPTAIFAPGNFIYYFLPGIKVKVFHGYPINKRNYEVDNHFRLRGWFDMLCTAGDSAYLPFKALSEQHPYFKVYKTGWAKMDDFFPLRADSKSANHLGRIANPPEHANPPEPVENVRSDLQSDRPTILYGSTFSKRLTSAYVMPDVIEKIAKEKAWNWLLTLHPKLNDPELLERYHRLADEHDNITFKSSVTVEDMLSTDAMLCDSSSIILEYMMLQKPVVTYRNSQPGDHLINIIETDEVMGALEKALTRPPELMEAIDRLTAHHEAFRDGQNCRRILDAVDDFIANYQGRLAPKPKNISRKIIQRWKSLTPSPSPRGEGSSMKG